MMQILDVLNVTGSTMADSANIVSVLISCLPLNIACKILKL